MDGPYHVQGTGAAPSARPARGRARPLHPVAMSRRTVMLGLTAFGALTVLASSFLDARPLIVWNVTASAPIGLYLILPARRLAVGDLVLLRLDTRTAAMFADRGYLPYGVPLLKRIAALSGTRVCAHDGTVTVGGRRVADAAPVDGAGRPLVAWSGCRALGDDECFALNPDVPGSLDGRYFGPSPLRAVIGRAIPLWTTGGQ